jgi:hypothetical protein
LARAGKNAPRRILACPLYIRISCFFLEKNTVLRHIASTHLKELLEEWKSENDELERTVKK